MPSGPVEDEQGVGVWFHLGSDFVRMFLHGLGIAAGHDQGGADAAAGADGSEETGGGGALVFWSPGAGSAFGPTAGDLVLLADAGLVLPPDF